MSDKLAGIIITAAIIWLFSIITYMVIKSCNKPEYSIELLKSNKIKVNNQIIELDSLEEFIDKDNL